MTGVSTLGQALKQIELLKNAQSQFATLTTQLTTGKKTQKFSGLGNDVVTSERARANFKSLDVYIANITRANTRIELTNTAVKEFKQQAENFAAALVAFSQQSVHQEGDTVYYDDPATTAIEQVPLGKTSATPDVDLKTLQDLASNVYEFISNLVNTKDGDRYLLSGAETLTKPLNDTGSLDAAISTLLQDWKGGTLSTTQFISGLNARSVSTDPNAITDSIVGYSATLSGGTTRDIFVRIDDNTEINYTTLGNDQAFRDILVAASYFKSIDLGPVADVVDPNTLAVTQEGAPGLDMDEQKDNFFAVFNDLTRMVNAAIDRLEKVQFKLENVRARIDQTKKNHTNEKNLLLNAIGDVENIDVNDVAVKINSLQVQLDASYRVTARMQELSLVNFI